jgi:hypothetical protein
MKELTLERNLSHVNIVAKPSFVQLQFGNTKGRTLERSPMNASGVGKPSSPTRAFKDT